MILIVVSIAVIIAVILVCKFMGGSIFENFVISALGLLLLVLFWALGVLITQSFPTESGAPITTTQKVVNVTETRKWISTGKTGYFADALIISTEDAGDTDKIRTSTIDLYESSENIYVVTTTTVGNPLIIPFLTEQVDRKLYWSF